jgi:hypothetical protein
MTTNMPGEGPRPLAMRSQDDRGPSYTAAVERSEAAFAAVRTVLGDRGGPRMVDTAGDLAALMGELPPETGVLVADWPRIGRGCRPGPGWCSAVDVTMVTLAERPVTPVRDVAGREHDVMLPAVEVGEFLLPGEDAPAPVDTEASGYYGRAVEALERDEPGVSLAAVAALVHHIADITGAGSYSPTCFLADDSRAGAGIRWPSAPPRRFPGHRAGGTEHPSLAAA